MSQIRMATPDDLPLLAGIEESDTELFTDYFGRPPVWDAAEPGEKRAAESGFILVLGTPAIGFAHVLEVDGWAHLEQLNVRPEYQQRGHGRALVLAAMAEAAARGHRQMTLMTYADVPWNAPFYASCGFVETDAVDPFHLGLVEKERDLHLEVHGRRVLMTASVTSK